MIYEVHQYDYNTLNKRLLVKELPNGEIQVLKVLTEPYDASNGEVVTTYVPSLITKVEFQDTGKAI
ncbi:hypothetical protein [Priestia megaterium]